MKKSFSERMNVFIKNRGNMTPQPDNAELRGFTSRSAVIRMLSNAPLEWSATWFKILTNQMWLCWYCY